MNYGREITLDDVEIGSRVAVIIGGETFTLTIDELEEDIKNDRPGGGGKTDDGDERWFYMDQVTRVIRKAPEAKAEAWTTVTKAEATVSLMESRANVMEAVMSTATGEVRQAAARAAEAEDAHRAIVNQLLAGAQAARTEAAQATLTEAARLVALNKLDEARKILVPMRTRQARAAIAAIKAL